MKDKVTEGECCYCDDPKGDLLCEKCAASLYEDDDDDHDPDLVKLGFLTISVIFAIGVVVGYCWGMWTSSMLN